MEKDEEDELNRLFTIEELDRAIRNTKEKSSPGRDGIEYKMIKKLKVRFRMELLKIYNWCFTTGNNMDDWKMAQTIFIDKLNKEKVRPITLTSCTGKVMERMVNERLVWWAEKQNKFEKGQNGFRKGKSCGENLARLTADVEID